MEFKLNNVTEGDNVKILMFPVMDDCISMEITHKETKYNTLFDDVMFVYGKPSRFIHIKQYRDMFRCEQLYFNHVGVKLCVDMRWTNLFYYHKDSPFTSYTDFDKCQRECSLKYIHVREPKDSGQNIIVE